MHGESFVHLMLIVAESNQFMSLFTSQVKMTHSFVGIMIFNITYSLETQQPAMECMSLQQYNRLSLREPFLTPKFLIPTQLLA